MTRPFFPALLAAVLAVSAVRAAEPPASPSRADETERAKKYLDFLAGPECEGRGLETKGIKKAGDYISDQFKAMGLKPAFKDGYFQPFDVPGPAKVTTPLSFTLTDGKTTYEPKYKQGYVPTVASRSGKGGGGLAFAGYGITSDDPKWDDYAGLDAKGKVVVVLRRTPRYGDPHGPFGENHPLASFNAKIANAVTHGAAGIIFVSDKTLADATDPLLDPAMPFDAGMDGPVLHAKREVVDAVLAGSKTSLAVLEDGIVKANKPNSFPLDGWKAEAEVTLDVPKFPTRNVIGVLEGAGPLAGETVVVGGHYDHLGYGERGSFEKNAGQAHYGADDNASGTTGVLTLARRYAAMKDRQGRRLVFVCFSGEEAGLHGSKFYCANPPFPMDKTAFMVNLDMIGRMKEVDDKDAGKKRDRLVVYGTGTTPDLDKLSDAAAKALDLKQMKIPGGEGPSDHTSFYRKGVPVLFLFTGTHPDYHRPTDTPDKINVDGLLKAADFAQAVVDHYAAVKEKPAFTKTKGGEEDPTDPNSGKVSVANVPRLKFAPDNYGEDGLGVLVGSTTKDGPADKAGIKEGDYIVEVAGKPVRNMGTYMTAMGGVKPNTEVEIVVKRKGEKVTLKATPIK